MIRAVTALAMFGLALVPLPARADGLADEAELQFQLGAERYLAKDYRGALEHFIASNRLVPNKNVVFNIARSFEQLGRFADAHRYYIDALDGETDAAVATSLRAAIQRIAPNVAVLDVSSTPPGATIFVDRRDLGSRGRTPRLLALPPGKYEILLELDGHEPAKSGVVEAKLGAQTKVELSLVRIVGTIHAEGDPGTTMRVNDEHAEPACNLPCDLPIAPGAYTLHFSREGHQGVSRPVVVSARAVSNVKVELAPLTGSVVVSTDEREALVEIDGRSVGFTPAVVPGIPVGKRKVRVSLRGFAPIEREVEVKAGEQAELLELRLDPLREVTAASRFTESVEDAPGSVSIISRQELRAFAYPTIVEALRGVRGLAISNDSIYSSINVRGVGQPNDYGNRLLVLADGMVLNDDIIASSYVGYDGRTDLADLERIEVVRGAGSVLYGTGAISGVVNLVTRGRDAPNELHASAGTFEDGIARVSAGFQQKLDDDAGIWASVGLARSDGRSLALGPMNGVASSSVTSGIDAFRSGTTAGRAWWGPLTAQWLYTSRDLSAPLGAYDTVFGDPSTHFIDTRGMAELRFEPKVSEGVQLLFRGHANTYTFTGDYAYGDARNAERYEGTWLGGEARIVVTPLDDARALRISAGGTVERHIRAFMRGVATSTTTSLGDEFLNEDHPYTLGAAYALVEAQPAAWLRISAGARLDVYSTFGSSVSPRLSLIVRPWEHGVLKLLGGRAFRAPSVYELYYNDGGMTEIASPNLKPEQSWSGEIEYSHRIADDWVALAAVNATYLQDIIDTLGKGEADDPLRYVNTASPVLSAGGELELRREWRQGWMVAASYGYQEAAYRELPADVTSTDKRLTNAPRHLGSIKGVAPIVAGLANAAGRLTVEGPRRIARDSEDETDPAVIADVVLSGEVSRYHLRYAVGVYNLFDWRYALPITEGAPTPTLAQRGRTFLLELTLAL